MYEGDVSQSILQNPEKILREFDFREKPHAKIIKEIATFYKAYFKVFGIPENEYSTSGSEETFCFSVRKDHADFIAEGLYYYLMKKKEDYFKGFKSEMM